ncbi:MAG: diguanylate cyclase [Desulfarculaceae bacterium]
MPEIEQIDSFKNYDDLLTLLAAAQKHQKVQGEYWQEQEERYGRRLYVEMLHLLTRMSFEPDEAREHWFKILDHRYKLLQTLGRDVGVRVALCDYFVNIYPAVENPIIVEVNLFLEKEQGAVRDELTGLFNRRFFNSILTKQMAHSQRYHQPFSLLMMDVDGFKDFNDKFGHQAGDQALAEMAQILESSARNVDYLVRYGGDEFAVILPGAGKKEAMVAANRQRQAISGAPICRDLYGQGRTFTLSVGVATYPDDTHLSFDLVRRADLALYSAKSGGRDQVKAAEPEQRRHARIPYRAHVDFRRGGEEDVISGETRDISLGGLSMATRLKVEKGEPLELIVHAPELDKALTIHGLTVRLLGDAADGTQYQLGVSFNPDQENGTWRLFVEGLMEKTEKETSQVSYARQAPRPLP